MKLKTPNAEHLDVGAGTLEEHPERGGRSFPEGEVYVQKDMRGDNVFVVHSGLPGPNRSLMYLFGVLERCREEDLEPYLFSTYFPYMRQDGSFHGSDLNYARSLVEKMVEYYGVREIYTLDAHFSERDWTSRFPVENVSAVDLLLEKADSDIVVGPDRGAAERFGVKALQKERRGGEVEVSGELEVAGEEVLLVDDIVGSGGTMLEARDRLLEIGADQVSAAVVHGAREEGVRKVAEAFDDLYLTNSVRRDAANVPVEPLVQEKLNSLEPDF